MIIFAGKKTPQIHPMEIIDDKQMKFPPKNYLVESILVLIFCCLPFGIVGLINAAKVESAFYSGDEDEALRLSYEAGKWVKIGFFTGLTFILLYLIAAFVLGLSGLYAF